MVLSALRLTAILAALAFATTSTPAHAYGATSGKVYEVPEADRVSAKQLFARDAHIPSVGLSYMALSVDIPGRVYVRHVANETAVAAGLFGKLRVSGDTRSADI